MKIVSLEIKNVKSFQATTRIDFNKHFNVLVGPNGGGKSNLLDIINIVLRHFFIKTYKIFIQNNGTTEWEQIIEHPSFQNINAVLEKFVGDLTDSKISIVFEIEKQDIDNIIILKTEKDVIKSSLEYYGGHWSKLTSEIEQWDVGRFTIGQVLTYEIYDNNISPLNVDTPEHFYLRFLNLFQLFLIGLKRVSNVQLSPRYIYFSPYRADNHINLQASLSSENYYDLLAAYSSVTSRQPASLLKIASLYFAEKQRKLERDAGHQGYRALWEADDEVKLVSKYLEKLGYIWNLELKDANKNTYQIVLTKNNRAFNLSQASSGEKEIINVLLGIFAFNIKDGLIIIDEPEVHLHPRWQKLLIELFLDLTKLTNNQFILSTHSSAFISQETLLSITRIYRDGDESKVAAISQKAMPNAKDLLHIINSHNNEKIFFADKVVLVEGITDRIFFENLIALYQQVFTVKTEIIEVLEVHGKINLSKYRDLLNNLSIPNFIIADLDYLEEIGNDTVRKLFTVDYESINNNVIKHKKSQDGAAIAEKLEKAIETQDFEQLKVLFDYIKSRKKKLKASLTGDEQSLLNTFVNNKVSENIFLLKLGEVEKYLPSQSKHLEALIETIANLDYLNSYLSPSFSSQRQEISRIIFFILDTSEISDDKITTELKRHQINSHSKL